MQSKRIPFSASRNLIDLPIMSVRFSLRVAGRHSHFQKWPNSRDQHPWAYFIGRCVSTATGYPLGEQGSRRTALDMGTGTPVTNSGSLLTERGKASAGQGNHHSGSTNWRALFGGVSLGAAIFTLATYVNSRRGKGWTHRLLPCTSGSLLPCASCTSAEHSNSTRRSRQYNFLAQAVEMAAPSVVCIETLSTIFGKAIAVSSGSGFVVDETGYVLTNAHVVANARNVQVKLHSGQVVEGDVTDIDEVADLALVKLDLPPGLLLPALKFGSSTDLRPGEWVVALGSPLSLSNTITAGIVSSVLRPSKELGLQHYKPDMEYVQTDAPITIGNSGGPLVNLDGEVIGVNTMTAGPGISFAIPSDFAKNFLETATRTVKGKTKKYAIGISMLTVSPRVIKSTILRTTLPTEVTHGVFLANVWPNGAAAKAGLQRGDIIVRINGQKIHSSNQVYEKVRSGKTLTMEVARGAQWMTVTVHPEPLYPS